ncbi:glutamine-rich protein 2-like isoform X3 [Pipra filicauda]|uniref:Glutamine-rich protein 2-like isoform X3 n=1 Tax=Pipra filicauda TaxID=649802 RepID=A0A7R5L337_9PASS|nr:glutamine-rich protein 2-like isoform X3 [Pipra filicauda]
MATPLDTLSLSQLLDLAIGMPQNGAVHFAAMRKLLQAVLGHLDVQYLTAQEPWTGELSGPSLAELAMGMKDMKQEMESCRKLISEDLRAEIGAIKAEHSRVSEDIKKIQEAQAMAESKHLQEIDKLKAAQSRMAEDMKKVQEEHDQAMAECQDLREEIDRIKATLSFMEEDIMRIKETLALMKKMEDDIRKLREDIAKWKEETNEQITQQLESVLQKTKSELKKMEEQQEMKNSMLEQLVTETANQLNAQDQQLLQHMEDSFGKIQKEYKKFSYISESIQTDCQMKQKAIEMLFQSLERLKKEKVDEQNMLTAMDMKADKDALGSKVDCTQFEASMEGLDERLRKIQGQMSGQKQHCNELQQKLKDMMENKLDRGELKYFRNRLEEIWKGKMEDLENRILGDSAAGLRKQLPVPFTCLSCDRPVKTLVPGPHPETLPYFQPLPPSKDAQQSQRRTVINGKIPRVAPSTGNPQSSRSPGQLIQASPRNNVRLKGITALPSKPNVTIVVGTSGPNSPEQKDQTPVVDSAQEEPGPSTSQEQRPARTRKTKHVSWAPQLTQIKIIPARDTSPSPSRERGANNRYSDIDIEEERRIAFEELVNLIKK